MRRVTGFRTKSSRAERRSSRRVDGALSPGHEARGYRSGGRALTTPASWNRRIQLTGMGLTLPALAFAFAFMVYPVVRLVVLSFQDYLPLRSTSTTNAGLSNYAWLAGSDLVHQSIWVTIVFTVVSVAIEMAAGLALATLLANPVLESRRPITPVLSPFLNPIFILPFPPPPTPTPPPSTF